MLGLLSPWRWTLVRLQQMSLPELPFRAREHWRRRTDRELVAPDLPSQLLRAPAPRWPIDREAFRASIGEPDRERLRRDVKALLHDGFELLGSWRAPTARTAWADDPETRRRWPSDRFCFDIDFRRGGPDIKPSWELGRLQHLQLLAMAAFLFDDEPARQACIEDLRSWMAENPPWLGIGYAAGVEVACRIVSMLVVTAFVDELPREVNAAVWRTLDAHGRWLARYPSLYSSANNHRIAELGALCALGALAPELPDAADWLEEGVEGLCGEIELQIHDDGVGAEHTPTYQAWTMEWYLVALRALQGRGLGPCVERQLLAGADFLCSILDSDGNHPYFGDDDGTVVLRQALEPDRVVPSVAGATAMLLGRPEVCPRSWRMDVRAALLGVQPLEGERYQPRSRTFGSGYTVLHGEHPDRLVVFDHGPLGFRHLAAHGHADALSVWLHVDGRPVLVDAGTWRYSGHPPWRAFFRGTSAHNTVCVEDADQSLQTGPFTWGTRTDARATWVALGAGAVSAEHEGYMADFGVLHARSVRLGWDALVVRDELTGPAARRITMAWHFAPDLTLEEREGGWDVRRGDRVVVRVEPPPGLLARVVAQAELPGPGVHSPSYGKRKPAPTLLLEGVPDLPFTAVTTFRFAADV